MDYTYATVIIAAEDQATAKQEFPEYFNCGLSATGELPATHYCTSGPFSNVELDSIVNEAAWSKTVYFGNDAQGALSKAGLQIVSEPLLQ